MSWVASASPEKIVEVRALFARTRERMIDEGRGDTWVEFPAWKDALDALPDLEPLLGLPVEIQSFTVEALRARGIEVPERRA